MSPIIVVTSSINLPSFPPPNYIYRSAPDISAGSSPRPRHWPLSHLRCSYDRDAARLTHDPELPVAQPPGWEQPEPRAARWRRGLCASEGRAAARRRAGKGMGSTEVVMRGTVNCGPIVVEKAVVAEKAVLGKLWKREGGPR